MSDESMDEVMDWIVSGVREADSASDSVPPSSVVADVETYTSVCGLEVGSAFEIVRDHEALRGRWRVVKIDRGPRGTLRAWARRPASTDYLPLTEPQIQDALNHGWLLVVGDRRSGRERRRVRAEFAGPDRRTGSRRDPSRRRVDSTPPGST